jgi:hypothetical protein
MHFLQQALTRFYRRYFDKELLIYWFMFASLAHSYNFSNIAVLTSFAAKCQAVGSTLSLVNKNLLINTPVVSFSLAHSHNYSYVSV